MSVHVKSSPAGMIATFEGALNFSVNEIFERMLEQVRDSSPKPPAVEFDLSRVTQIDSVGLGMLYVAHEDLTGLGVPLTLSRPSASVDRLLDLTQSEKTFTIRR